jgi:hypothetical protein
MNRLQKPHAAFRFTRERGTVPSHPVVRGTTCYFSVTGALQEIIGVSLVDGNVLWRRPIDHFVPAAVTTNRLVLSTLGEISVVTDDWDEVWRARASASAWRQWRDLIIVAENPLRLHNIETGIVVGSIDLPAEPSVSTVSGDYYLGFCKDGRCIACDLVQKRVLWSENLQPVVEAVPGEGASLMGRAPGVGDVFILAFQSYLFAFSVMSGEFLWRRPIRAANCIPAITRERVYTWHQTDHRSPAQLICLDPLSGSIIFEVDLAAYAERFSRHMALGVPLVHSRAVVLTTEQGMVGACSPHDGRLLWLYQHKHRVYGRVIAGDELLVSTGDGLLLKFNL